MLEVNMKLLLLLAVTVSCYGKKWKVINDIGETFKEYSLSAENMMSTIENTINTSRQEQTYFINNKLFKNPALIHLMLLRSSNDKCYATFITKENLELSFQLQVFQLEIPLQRRIDDIREKLNDINSTIRLYEALADSKYWSCQLFNESCVELTEKWLETKIYSLACAMHPNCKKHSITKRSYCSPEQFTCPDDHRCINNNYFCDGSCNCNGCADEESGCVRHCTQFRCSETWRCVPSSKKCDGEDDCGDGSDEEGCPPPVYSRANCSTNTGGFLCDTTKCLDLERVCDGTADCADGTDEGPGCLDRGCSPDCSNKGGFCWAGPGGHECLYECPPGTFETSTGCSTRPELAPSILAQLMDDIPQLTDRYAARMKYLRTKTMMRLLRSMVDVVKCKGGDFASLSKVIEFSSELNGQNKSTIHPFKNSSIWDKISTQTSSFPVTETTTTTAEEDPLY